MEDKDKTKKQLIDELVKLRKKIAVKNQSDFEYVHDTGGSPYKLQKSEKKFQASLETLLDGFGIFSAVRDQAGKIVDFRYDFINDAGCKLNQRTREEQIGKTLLELLPEHQEAGLMKEYARVVEAGKPLIKYAYFYEDTFGQNKRLSRVFDFRAVKLGDGFAVTWRDVTEHKKIEEDLKISEEKYQDLYDNAPDMFCSVDAKTTTVIRCNQTLVQQTGYTREEIIGHTIFDRYHPDCIEGAKKAFQSFASIGEVHDAELQLKKKDGGKIDVSLNVSAVRDELGNVLYSRSNWRDISERKHIENVLKKSEQEIHKFAEYLQSAREKERALVASELHDEVGQALTGIKMDIFMIKNKMSKDKKEIPSEFQKMEKLLDDSIKRLRKIYSDLRPSLLEHFGIGEAIKQFVADFQEESGTKCTFYQDPEEIILDENRSIALYRILQGAINNVKWHSMATKADIRLEEKGPNLKLTIRDNGKGIKKEQINSGESFGLIGMSERARYLGGELEIKGLPNKGTTITLEIPLNKTDNKVDKDQFEEIKFKFDNLDKTDNK